jgi:hypothetical protein
MYTHCEIGEYIIASVKLDAGITRELSQFSENYNGAKQEMRFKHRSLVWRYTRPLSAEHWAILAAADGQCLLCRINKGPSEVSTARVSRIDQRLGGRHKRAEAEKDNKHRAAARRNDNARQKQHAERENHAECAGKHDAGVPTFAAAIVAARRDGHDAKSGKADQGDKKSAKKESKVARGQEQKIE